MRKEIRSYLQFDHNSNLWKSYQEVRGIVRAYQFGSPDAFHTTKHGNIDSNYVDGISITHGKSPRKHIWTYAIGFAQYKHNYTFILAQTLEVVKLNQHLLALIISAPQPILVTLVKPRGTGHLYFIPAHCGPISEETALIVEMMTCFSA